MQLYMLLRVPYNMYGIHVHVYRTCAKFTYTSTCCGYLTACTVYMYMYTVHVQISLINAVGTLQHVRYTCTCIPYMCKPSLIHAVGTLQHVRYTCTSIPYMCKIHLYMLWVPRYPKLYMLAGDGKSWNMKVILLESK